MQENQKTESKKMYELGLNLPKFTAQKMSIAC